MFSDLKLILMLGGAAILVGIGVYWYGRMEGSQLCEARHAQEQLKLEVKARKSYEKIDRSTPFSANRATRIEWLLQHARK